MSSKLPDMYKTLTLIIQRKVTAFIPCYIDMVINDPNSVLLYTSHLPAIWLVEIQGEVIRGKEKTWHIASQPIILGCWEISILIVDDEGEIGQNPRENTEWHHYILEWVKHLRKIGHWPLVSIISPHTLSISCLSYYLVTFHDTEYRYTACSIIPFYSVRNGPHGGWIQYTLCQWPH